MPGPCWAVTTRVVTARTSGWALAALASKDLSAVSILFDTRGIPQPSATVFDLATVIPEADRLRAPRFEASEY